MHIPWIIEKWGLGMEELSYGVFWSGGEWVILEFTTLFSSLYANSAMQLSHGSLNLMNLNMIT